MITEFMHNHKAEQAAAGQRLGEQQDNKARSTHLAFSFFCVCACVCVRESSFAFFLWKMHFVLSHTSKPLQREKEKSGEEKKRRVEKKKKKREEKKKRRERERERESVCVCKEGTRKQVCVCACVHSCVPLRQEQLFVPVVFSSSTMEGTLPQASKVFYKKADYITTVSAPPRLCLVLLLPFVLWLLLLTRSLLDVF